jgi:putative endopeptidase
MHTLQRLALSGFVLSLATAACGSVSDEPVEITADELAAMAVPGVDETALDRSVDPCVDFYSFACGGYVASLPADTKRETRSFTQLQKERNAILAQVVDEMSRAPRTDAEKKAATFYASCLAHQGLAAPTTSSFVAGFRAEIDAANSPAEIAGLIGRMHRRRVNAFFGFFPTADTETQGRHGAAVVFPAGHDRRTDYTKEESRAARATALARGVLLAEPGLGDAEAARLAAAAVGVEKALASASAALPPNQSSHPVGRRGLEAAAPNVDWASYFGAFGTTNLGDFQVSGLEYFNALDRILATTDMTALHAYLTTRWYEATTRDAGAPANTRAPICMSELQWGMSDAVEGRFLELAGVDSRARAKANALWRAITDAFGEQLREPSFLDVPTRVEALVKLDKMRAAIGASRKLDDFADLAFDAEDSFVSNKMRIAEREFERDLGNIGKQLPLLHVDFPAPFVNASYDGSLNKINVPGGILGGYFFSPKAPKLANFSAIGTVLGHELTHGFDTSGRHLDGDGLDRDWWTPQVDAAFQERAQCVVDQYSAFTLDGVPDPVSGEIPAHVNGKLTIGENIADNGGVKTAYRAAKVEGRTSPVTAGFTPPQQFFIGYGQLWCSKTAPDVASSMLASDPHSPPKARVNLPLANFDKFASTFQCKAGTPMAPAQRCGVW